MTIFEDNYFQKRHFTEAEIRKFVDGAMWDLAIAKASTVPEVVFRFAYDALIKFGIALIVNEGYRIRSVPGHHAKIIEKMSEILRNEDVLTVGNVMRQARNRDLYEGAMLISEKDSGEYFRFVDSLMQVYPDLS